MPNSCRRNEGPGKMPLMIQGVLLDRAGHYPQVERPGEFFQQVEEFLDGNW